ncbi:type II toxin-antitoxin system mRNA interferase toxin, RelE/StbE family [Candidatus Shapirobacteria bacterium CG09_land_8_20_14_0_10_39_12]|uniref:Type II toxin-antitoxin system mRNA interferase toxin, RelE/StbE family n=1 Tax=Candidatus Shapirobacteria bacterium CG09_land_8_20_14_0_10_39_12 TaxID=1974885 RepID=A0A2H0WNN5_9BACT|nr:MAG: type II toxin-antitoxin system mRNA interferase toxin, RelE/StbE family [Candidatus Shapirobacteria bacterium CG09_land_8_20_14_0_10_39_12]
MSSIVLSKNAEKEFVRLPKIEKKKIFKKILTFQDNPFAGKLLTGELQGLFSLRAWPYRIIYELKKPDKIIIHHILHRQRAYK